MTTLIPKFDLMNGGSTPTGAINRPINQKLGDFVSVKDFGAVGDGTTDDTAAIQAAFNSLKATGGSLYIPKGTYKVPNGIDFHQTTAESSYSYYIYGDGRKDSIIVTTNANIGLDLGGRNRVFLKDFGIEDNGTTAKVGIARYRDTTIGSDGGGSYHVYDNIFVAGMFSAASIYSIGSEVNSHYNLELLNTGNGACYFTSDTNYLSVTAAGTITGGSNTVNNFYGGSFETASGTSGGAVYVSTGITDNLNFYSSYLVGWTGGYIVKLGYASSDTLQGSKMFDGCRFEGTGIAFGCTGNLVGELQVTNSTFGQSGQDIYFFNTGLTGQGFIGANIQNNFHYGKGMTIPVITSSTINVPALFASTLDTTITVNEAIVSSSITGLVSLGSSCVVYGSIITKLDSINGISLTQYGPNSPTSAGNSQGSLLINNPFGTAPTSPLVGALATAAPAYWDATKTGTTEDYPVFYDGTNWKGMMPVPATISGATANGVAGTIAYDANYMYICVATNTWKRIALTW
jgi:hypothetical protein